MSCHRPRGLGATLAVFAALLLLGSTGFPRTAWSSEKPCGVPGTPTCPHPAPLPTPLKFFSINTQSYGYGQFWSLGEIFQWITDVYEPNNNRCAPTLLGITQPGTAWGTTPQYQYGIIIKDSYILDVRISGRLTPPPSCTWTQDVSNYDQALATRSVYCPIGYGTLVYQAGPPTVGPYCGQPNPPTSSTPPSPKVMGTCPKGGATVKGNPCDVSNGNKYEAETDYQGAGANPLRFVRSYNSLAAYFANHYPTAHPLGIAWTATFFQSLLPVTVTDSTTTYSTVYAMRPDGRILTFVLYQGVYVAEADVGDKLSAVVGGYQYRTADDTVEAYDSAGKLLSITPRGGTTLTVNHASGSAYPTSVSDAFGHTLSFSYTLDSHTKAYQLASVTNPAGRIVSYTYDTSSRLTSVSYPDGTSRSYSYGATGLSGSLTSLKDESNTTYATWTYSADGLQPTGSAHAGGADSYAFSFPLYASYRTVTDPLGVQRTYNQQYIQQMYRTTSVSQSCGGCGDDASTAYDANGNVTARTDFNGVQTTYTFDQDRNLETSRTEAYGTPRARTITTQWSPDWRLPTLITEANRTTGFTYDSSGNLLTKTITDTSVTPNVTRTWTYTYNSFGQVLTEDGPRTDVSDVTTYAYYNCSTGFQCGQVQTITDALGHVTTFNTYNAHGQPLTVTDPNGVVTTLAYDARQRLTSRQVGSETTTFDYWPTGLLKKVTLPDGSYLLYTYDAAHRLTRIDDGAGNYVVYTLDAMENRTAENVYDPSSFLTRTHSRVFNSLNELWKDLTAAGTAAQTTVFGYDPNGNQTTINAPLSRNTTNAYDELNRLKQVTDPASGITQLAYDANDNLTSVTDPRSKVTSYTYTGFGDLATQVSPDTGTTSDSYDSGGNLATSTDARSATATYSYDALNRVTQIAYGDQTISFGYDAGTNGIGRLTSASDANHSLTWSYDAQGRMTGKTQTVGTVSKSVAYGYTSGNLTSLTTPSGQSIVYGYNSNHQVTSVSVNGTTLLSAVLYDPFGPVRGWTWGNGTLAVRTYDTDGKITQVDSAGLSTYAYDDALRITAITDTANGANSYTYGFDALDRLTSAVKSGTTRGWSYDANGNRLSESGSFASSYTISGTSNRVSSISGTLARSYGYDAAGNVLGDGTMTATYNNRGRLSTLTVGGSTETIVYNALGQRVKVSGGVQGTVFHLYDEAGHLLGEYDASGNLLEETVWLGDIPVATLRPNGSTVSVYYVHTDHLNTPRRTTRPSDNTLMWTWSADPFGSESPNENPQGAGVFGYNLRFPGQLYDPQAGLSYNYFRDYDSAIGRYVESDPIGFYGGINTYAYALGNPVSLRDPLGLLSCGFFDCPSLPQSVVNISAGIGDALLLNQGARLRRLLNINSVDTCSGSYKGGQLAGIIGTFLTGEGEATILSNAAHYVPRLIEAGVDVANAQVAVVREIQAMQAALAEGESLGALSGRITVDGVLVQYNAFPISGGAINIGTIFPVLW